MTGIPMRRPRVAQHLRDCAVSAGWTDFARRVGVSYDHGRSVRQEGGQEDVTRREPRRVERAARYLAVAADALSSVDEDGEHALADLPADDGPGDPRRLYRGW